MTTKQKDPRPDEIAADAAKASERGSHREAEKLYLTAAARASAYTNSPTMKKNMAHWDKCASRERRLAELTREMSPHVPLVVELTEDEKAMVSNGDIIGTIKNVRARMGIGLKDAKDAVDAYRARMQ